MNRMRPFKTGLITLTSLGLILSGPVLQATATDTGSKPGARGDKGRVPAVTDVVLQPGGTLLGQVVDAQGKPLAETQVSIRQADREFARTVTDVSGRFRGGDLRGGTYRIVAGEAAAIFRLWAPGTAPPSARPIALVVSGDDQLVLGQYGRILECLRNPWVVAGIVAVAIAVPIAIHNLDRDDESRSD